MWILRWGKGALMACDCEQYINCNDSKIEVGTYDDTAQYSHSVSNAVKSDDVLGFYEKTVRSFSVRYGWDRSVGIDHVLSGCGNDTPMIACDTSGAANASSSCSDHCIRETNVPWYWDRQRGIYVWKHTREEMIFSIASSKTARFKMKFGNGYFHKICIPTSVRTNGIEQFVMVKGGVKSVLAEVSYSYNPFPATESGGATWGLYGNTVTRSAVPDTADVACILLFPTVPKQAIAMDNDVIAYGFYDYNAIEGGFVESGLPADDGGKDYFYPYWCRAMPTDPLWRSVADQRYEVIYSAGQMNLGGTGAWYPSAPTEYPFPFGSFALDSKENFIASCILQFGEHAGSQGVVYNEASFGDLFAAIKLAGAPLNGSYSAVYPVTPL